ncbi:hypothetical protein JCM1840_003639 [Sporobolomyces johnsonii]
MSLPPTEARRSISSSRLGRDGAQKKAKWDRWIKEASCHASMVIAGWSDASSGPLIPYIQSYYGISYTVVSMLFVGQMVGFLTAALANSALTSKFGLGKVMTMGAVIQAVAYALLIPAFPFPLFPVCYAISGFGMALQDASANVYIATLPNAEHRFGLLHASYGLGAAICPLAATAFASSGRQFSHFWAISVAIACLNVVILIWAFRFNYVVDTSEPIATGEAPGLSPIDLVDPPSPREEIELEEQRAGSKKDEEGLEEEMPSTPRGVETTTIARRRQAKKSGILYQTLSSRAVWLCSLFILFYVGSEVSMGGWIVTFLIDNRNGGPSAGYVATGFWLGITVGRATLNPLNMWIGEKRVIYLYLALALCMEFAIWFADSLVGNAVVVAIVGVVLGPLYPVSAAHPYAGFRAESDVAGHQITMSICTKILPRKLHSSGIAFIAAFGQTGSAIFPFVTGALAQRFSPAALQPVMVFLFAVQLVMWWFVPDVVRKVE